MYTSDALLYTRGILIPRLLGVRNYLNNYFAMYTRLTLPYTRGTRIPHLLGLGNYLNNYFAMYNRLPRSCIQAELATPAYLGLRIIVIIILRYINV